MGGTDFSEKMTFERMHEREAGASQAKSSGKSIPEKK